MQQLEGFVLKDRSVICPDCQVVFAVRALVDLPPVTDADIVEADMHRVMPLAGLRAALIAVCPECNYADWVTKFPVSIINPQLVPDAADVPHSSKFAMAVKYARERNIHPLDIAYIALNGMWCAREAGEQTDAWLELCVYEQHRGLDPENIVVETGSDHLMMGELWRQMGCFDKAIEEYGKAGMDETVPAELIRQQTTIARAGDNSPTVLPPWMVRLLFPEAAEIAVSTAREPHRSTDVIIVHADPLAKLKVDETGVPRIPTLEERPEWARNTRCDLPIEAAFDEQEPTLAEVEEQLSETIMEALSQAPEPEVETVALLEEPAAVDFEPGFESLEAGMSPLVEDDLVAAGESPLEQPLQVEPELTPPPINPLIQPTAVKAGSSLISLVPSHDGSSVSIAVSTAAVSQEIAAAVAERYAADDQFAGAQKPNKEDKDPTSKALKKAMRAGKKVAKLNVNEHFPAVQILDEDSGYAYTASQKPMPEAQQEEEVTAQPAAAAAAQAQPAKTPQQAIAQVESFLSLTRQPSYQNWVRGYRK